MSLHFDPLVTNEISYPYQLNLILGAFGAILHFYFTFFDENQVSKQKSPRWDTPFCGVSSGAILFRHGPN